jgi:hypothetical protein
MAHLQQAEFVAYCRLQYPQNFKDCKVLEVGSLDITAPLETSLQTVSTLAWT